MRKKKQNIEVDEMVDTMHAMMMDAYKRGVKDGIQAAADGLKVAGDMPITTVEAAQIVQLFVLELDSQSG